MGLPLFPGASEYNLLQRMLESIGQPPVGMLQRASKTSKYFKIIGSGDMARFELLSVEEFEAAHRTKVAQGKRYFKHTRLTDIILSLPYRKGLSEEETASERERRAAFLDMLFGMMKLDPTTRWTPQQALTHPFITGDRFTEPFQPGPEEAAPSQSAPVGIHFQGQAHQHRPQFAASAPSVAGVGVGSLPAQSMPQVAAELAQVNDDARNAANAQAQAANMAAAANAAVANAMLMGISPEQYAASILQAQVQVQQQQHSGARPQLGFASVPQNAGFLSQQMGMAPPPPPQMGMGAHNFGPHSMQGQQLDGSSMAVAAQAAAMAAAAAQATGIGMTQIARSPQVPSNFATIPFSPMNTAQAQHHGLVGTPGGAARSRSLSASSGASGSPSSSMNVRGPHNWMQHSPQLGHQSRPRANSEQTPPRMSLSGMATDTVFEMDAERSDGSMAADTPSPNPADWDPTYSDDQLLHEEGLQQQQQQSTAVPLGVPDGNVPRLHFVSDSANAAQQRGAQNPQQNNFATGQPNPYELMVFGGGGHAMFQGVPQLPFSGLTASFQTQSQVNQQQRRNPMQVGGLPAGPNLIPFMNNGRPLESLSSAHQAAANNAMAAMGMSPQGHPWRQAHFGAAAGSSGPIQSSPQSPLAPGNASADSGSILAESTPPKT